MIRSVLKLDDVILPVNAILCALYELRDLNTTVRSRLWLWVFHEQLKLSFRYV